MKQNHASALLPGSALLSAGNADAKASEAARLRQEGGQVISGPSAVDDNAREARRLGCTHLAVDAKITEIETLNDNQDGD